MKLKTAIERYIRHKESLGIDFDSSARLLWRYWRILGDIDVGELTAEATNPFIFGSGPITSTLHARFHTIRGLVRYMLSRNYISSSPLPADIPKQPSGLIPHIYPREELRRILDAAAIQSSRNKIDSDTLRTLVLLLYACGLRLGEALRLTISDLDLDQDVLTIHDTKFYKTRCVPFGVGVKRVLLKYLLDRSQHGHPTSPDAFLLLTKHSLPISVKLADSTFKRLCDFAGVRRRPPHARYGPRLHDLRHTFAVDRLTACYQEGGDPQALLPKLSTYLGHVDIGSTKIYLTMTPELLRFAGERFEQYAAKGGSND